MVLSYYSSFETIRTPPKTVIWSQVKEENFHFSISVPVSSRDKLKICRATMTHYIQRLIRICRPRVCSFTLIYRFFSSFSSSFCFSYVNILRPSCKLQENVPPKATCVVAGDPFWWSCTMWRFQDNWERQFMFEITSHWFIVFISFSFKGFGKKREVL